MRVLVLEAPRVTSAAAFATRWLAQVTSSGGVAQRPGGIVLERVVTGDIGSTTRWQVALRGVDVVEHLAPRVQILHDRHYSSSLYTEANARGTHRLANAATEAGVSRFVYAAPVR
jgi:nucleoside-diphosphate-sugar epimerase